MKYRKKPVVVEAVRWDGDNLEEVVGFAGGDVYWHVTTGRLMVPTLEGDMTASEGDYIIKGVRGEFYPCKPGIFEETYDVAVDDE